MIPYSSYVLLQFVVYAFFHFVHKIKTLAIVLYSPLLITDNVIEQSRTAIERSLLILDAILASQLSILHFQLSISSIVVK